MSAVSSETEPIETVPKETVPVDSVTIKQSPDKYTWYIRNYVGKNCASFGYTSMGGDRMDHYGAGYIDFRTLALLYCLMVVVAGLRHAGVFAALAHRLCERAGSVRLLGLMLVLLCFFLPWGWDI